MLQGWFVIAVALGYIGLLFGIASYGDRRIGGAVRQRLWIYPLSLAIYCTSWTFFGSVGLATRDGFNFLAIYIGPILVIGLAYPLIIRITRLSKAQNIVSIADFIGARYGKHQGVAAAVALIAIVGTIPYIALQLKAISSSLGAIVVPLETVAGPVQPMLGDPPLFVALSLAAFAVLFGTRHIDATEHQHGLMLAVAVESVVKLVAFVAVGAFVTFKMFDGPAALFAKALARPDTAAVLTSETNFGMMAAMTLLSCFAVILLPRQFYVTVVENKSDAEIRRAAWVFPLYLVIINLFVMPVALAGMLTFAPGTVDSDMYVLALPIAAGSEMLALVAFIGGLSAAAAMVIVESVALAIMVSNDIVVPLALRRRDATNVGTHLLTVRRVAIFAVLLLAYLYYRLAGEAQLAAIGLMAFAAVAQLAPSFFGGLDMAARHRRRCARRHDRRHPGLGLHAAAAEPRRCRDRPDAARHRRAVRLSACCGRRRCSASTCRRSSTACCGASRSTSSSMSRCRSRGRRRRSSACRPMCSSPPISIRRRASGCGARR